MIKKKLLQIMIIYKLLMKNKKLKFKNKMKFFKQTMNMKIWSLNNNYKSKKKNKINILNQLKNSNKLLRIFEKILI